MAGGPYKGTSGWYHLRWSDKNNHPEQPRKTESLKTKKKKVAGQRKAILETLYPTYHNPWSQPWYDNAKIAHIVKSGNLDINSLSNDLTSEAGVMLSDMVEDYISYKTSLRGSEGWSDNMARSAPYTLRGFVDFVGASTHPDNIDEFDIQDYLYQPSINSDHTRESYLRRIKACFNWGRDKGYTTTKITYSAQSPQRKIPKFLTRRELIDICGYQIKKNQTNVRKGFTQPDNTSLWMIYGWLLMASTGMRPDELMHLKVSDVQPIIQVGRNKRTKTGQQRTIPHYRWTPQILSVLLNEDNRQRDRWMKKRDWLFGRHGDQAQRHLSDYFREARKAVVPEKDIPLYKLRNSFAVWFLTNENELSGNTDARLYKLMQILGHKRLETTQKYLGVIPMSTQLQ